MIQDPVGTHCLIELHHCPFDLLNDEDHVRQAVVLASERALATLLKLSSHRFEPQGVTALGLLAESHISIHTWPENNYAAVDIFTCGDTADPRLAYGILVELFEPERHYMVVLERGGGLLRAAEGADRIAPAALGPACA